MTVSRTVGIKELRQMQNPCDIILIPIIKALKGSEVFILLENNDLPKFPLTRGAGQPIEQVSKCIQDTYNIKSSWIEIYYVGMYYHVYEDQLYLYYSTFVPLDFLVSETHKKMSNSYGHLSSFHGEQIRQALSLSPY